MGFNTYPQNPFPSNSELLQKLDAVAKAIEDMPTFTSNDKAFLEELPAFPSSDGVKVLTATTESDETVLSWEDAKSDIPIANYSETVTTNVNGVANIGTIGRVIFSAFRTDEPNYFVYLGTRNDTTGTTQIKVLYYDGTPTVNTEVNIKYYCYEESEV